MEYKAELYEDMRCKWTYEDNTYTSYDLLWEQCGKAIQNNIASISDYDSLVYNIPIALLWASKEHLLNYQNTRYEMAITPDALWSKFISGQKYDESWQYHTKWFNMSTEILDYHLGGPLILEKYVDTMEGYDATNPNKTKTMVKNLRKVCFAYLYLDKSVHDNYWSMKQSLNSHKSLGNYHYPRTIVDMNNVLSNHKLDINTMRNKIISTQSQTITRRINRTKKPRHYRLRKWKEGDTVAKNRGTNLQNA